MDLPLKNGRKRKITIPVIPPHEILHAVHRAGKLQFHISMLGSDGYENIKVFWENALRQTWGRCHPAAVNKSRLRKTIPVVIHIDGVATYTDSEANIYSLSSALASGCTWDTKFVLCVVPVFWHSQKGKSVLSMWLFASSLGGQCNMLWVAFPRTRVLQRGVADLFLACKSGG